MGSRGPQPTSLEVLEKRGSWRAVARKKAARKTETPAAPKLKRGPSLAKLEDHCRELIPGYDPWATAAEGEWFDLAAAKRAVMFFHQRLVHVKGKKYHQPFILEPWQRSGIGNLFGWKRANGLRRYRRTFWFVPRKNGKSPLAAGVINYMLFEDGEHGAEIYGAASTHQQATLVFEHARGMVLHDEKMRDRCKVYSGQAKAIQIQEDWSTYRVVASDAFSAHGWNTHLAVADELHAWDSGELLDAMTTSTAAREQPLVFIITTSDFDRESVCNRELDYATKVRSGVIEDPTFLPVLYEAKPEDDWTDPKVWAKANPNLGVSVNYEYIETECKRAQEASVYENTFKRLHLNIKTRTDVRWLAMDKWDACGGDLDPSELAGQACFVGLDLASTTDVAALVLLFPECGNAVLPFFWVPSESARVRERRDRVPYETWARQGLIEMTEGNVIDYDVIRRRINELGETYNIREIGVDRWNAQQIITQLNGDGFEIVPFGQGFASMSGPSKELEKLVLSCDLRHGDNPVLRWMASNVMAETDAAGNIKPSKKKSKEKIDGIVALVMALGRAAVAEVEKPSVYESRGVLIL